MKRKIQNPILRGFHPDPSIIRVGEDYCIASGICCQDLTGAGLYADFDYFEVKAN